MKKRKIRAKREKAVKMINDYADAEDAMFLSTKEVDDCTVSHRPRPGLLSYFLYDYTMYHYYLQPKD